MVPQIPPLHTSTLPSLDDGPSMSLMLPSSTPAQVEFGTKVYNDLLYVMTIAHRAIEIL